MRCLFIGLHIIYSSYIPFRALEYLDIDVCLVGRDRPTARKCWWLGWGLLRSLEGKETLEQIEGGSLRPLLTGLLCDDV